MNARSNFICTILGCSRKAHSQQMCQPHYRRFKKYGDPLFGRALVGEKRAWLEAHVSYEGRDCLYSPLMTGPRYYWSFNEGGQQYLAHRWMCEAIHGPNPPEKYQAAHSCGNGQLGCVNPNHLSWATPKENSADYWEAKRA